MADPKSYRDRTGNDAEEGSAITVNARGAEVHLELGVMRRSHSLLSDAWAALTPEEARELADDLMRAAREVEKRSETARG